MGQQITSLPDWVSAIIAQFGISVDDALAEFNALAVKYDAPDELKTAVTDWVKGLGLQITDPTAFEHVVLGIVAELTSKAPGFNPDAGALQ